MIQKLKNVHDFLQNFGTEGIKEYCQKKTMPHALAMMQTHGDFNIATMIRNANFFGFERVYYIGRRHFDRRGTVGTHLYTTFQHFKTFDDFVNGIKGMYSLVAVENNVDYKCHIYNQFEYPDQTVLLFGEEQAGLSNDILDKCEAIVSIPAYGSVRSLNVGTASGILAGHLRARHEQNFAYTK